MTKLDTGPVTPAEAREIARRYNASHFQNARDLGEIARYTIPADPRRDDDLRLGAFIDQAEEAMTCATTGHCASCAGRAAKAETERDALAAENARLRAELADLPRLRELDDSIVGLEEALDELEAIAVEHNDPHGFTAEWKAQQVVCQEAKRRRAAAITVARDARAKAAPACPHGYAAGLRCPWLCKAKAAPEGGGA